MYSDAPEVNNNTPEITAVVISYNTRDMTLQCLQTLTEDLQGAHSEIRVVDNASSDGSPAAIRSNYPDVHLIESHANLGFGGANNQAMRLAKGEFILLLNSDAFPKPGAIRSLIDYLREHPGVGVVGPRLLNADGTLQPSCYPYPSPSRAWFENLWISTALPHHPVFGDYRRWKHDRERIVDWVIGACMLVRRQTFEDVGGFDEGFFMYSEEADWQRRMKDKGWDVAFTPRAVVTHLGGASGANEKPRINRHFFDSLDYYEWKHHGTLGLVSLRIAMVIGCFLRMLLWAVVAVCIPGRRPAARAKTRFLAWLCFRQATHWRLSLKSRAQAGKD